MFPGNELYSSLRERSPGMNFIPVSENVPWERIVCIRECSPEMNDIPASGNVPGVNEE